MAGDWIKMRMDLGTSPKVVRMSSALRADRLRVVGGLHAVWCLFDVHSEDGKLEGYTLEAIDELIGFAGFGAAMVAVGWLSDCGDYLSVPRFDEHNGQSAKRRAMDTERKRENRKVSASGADKTVTREEKRREEKNPSSLRSEGAVVKRERVSGIVSETLPLPPELTREAWRDWVHFRSSIKKPLNEQTANKQIEFLCEAIRDGYDPKAIINESIRNSWQGLFLKDSHRKGGTPKQAESFYEREDRLKREEAAKWGGAPSTDDFLTIDAEVHHVPAIEGH